MLDILLRSNYRKLVFACQIIFFSYALIFVHNVLADDGVAETSCEAVYTVSEQSLDIPCLTYLDTERTVSYRLKLITQNSKEFSLTSFQEILSPENACAATFSSLTGKLYLPCVLVEVSPKQFQQYEVFMSKNNEASVFLLDSIVSLNSKKQHSGNFGTRSGDYGSNCSTAPSVAVNSNRSARLETAGDVDYFKVIVPTTGVLIVSTTGTIDTYGYLKDSNCNDITSNDDNGADINFRISQSVVAGTYYIAARGYYPSATGSYTLDISLSTSVSVFPAPSLSSPSNSGSLIPNSPTDFVWSTIQGADNYRIVISSQSNFGNVDNQTGNCISGYGTDCFGFAGNQTRISSSQFQFQTGRSYFWKVRAGNASAGGNWSEIRSFTVGGTVIPSLSPPSLISPSNGGNLALNSVTVLSWSAIPTATSYRVVISTRGDFSNVANMDSISVTPSCTTSNNDCFNLPITTGATSVGSSSFQLQAGVTYYWKVRAGNASTGGNWSTAGSFIAGNTSVPTTIFSTGAYQNNQTLTETLSVPNASSLTVTVSGVTESRYDYITIADSNGVQLQSLSGNINTTFTASGSSVRVTFTSDSSVSPADGRLPNGGVTVTVSSSSTLALLPAPSLTSPNNGSNLAPTVNSVLSWSAVPTATSYRVVISTRGDFSNVANMDSISVMPSCTTSNNDCFNLPITTGATSVGSSSFQLQAGVTYYWKVRAGNASTGGNWSEIRSFTVQGITSTKPAYPVLLVYGRASNIDTWSSAYINRWNTNHGMNYGGAIQISDRYGVLGTGTASQAVSIPPSSTSTIFSVPVEITGGLQNKDFYTVDFSSNNSISFAAQGLQVKAAVSRVLELTGAQGVYIVAHSMGGLASRAYLQYFNDNRVKGLITIGTPHLGSPLGLDALISFGFGSVAGQLASSGSNDLHTLNNYNSISQLPSATKYFAFVIRGQTYALGRFSDAMGDGIVSIFSQSFGNSGWPTQEITIAGNYPEVHTHETEDTNLSDIVFAKLVVDWR